MKIINKDITAIKTGSMQNRMLGLGMLVASLMLASASASAWSDNHAQRYEHRHDYRHEQRVQHDRGLHRQHVKQQLKERARYRAAQRHAAYHQWRRGEYLPVAYHSPRYVVHNWRAYHLSAPPRGHEWLRIDGRFVQVSVGNHRVSRIW